MATKSTNVTYLKGIRTKYRNFLVSEIDKGKDIQRIALSEIDEDACIVMIEKCIEKIEHYSKKVEIHMEKLSSVLDDSESEFMENGLANDSQVCADAMECCIDLKQLKKTIIKAREVETSLDKSSLKTDSDKLADMQSLILNQMKQQQDFFRWTTEQN